MTAFIITFRETLEAALIVGLLLSLVQIFYKKIGLGHFYILAGVVTGIICSFLFTFMFAKFFGGFEGFTEKVYEGILMFFAFGMITHLLLWTNKNAKKLTGDLKSKVKKALEKSELWVLFTISALTVSREGVETVIFMNALDVTTEPQNIAFGFLGIGIALLLSAALFFGLKQISIAKIFKISNTMLLFIAAGLLAHGIVEFQGAGIIPTLVKPVFDISHILSESEGVGALLKAMFGYDANPSLIAVIAYFLFLGFFMKYLGIFGGSIKSETNLQSS